MAPPDPPRAHFGIATRGGKDVSTKVEVRVAGAEALESEEARNLLEAAQAAGSVSQEDIALALDELDLDAGQIDEFYKTLEEMQVEVVAAVEDEKEVPVAETREISTDSLQLFLKDIAKADLLTAAQEVELAKRIERGD